MINAMTHTMKQSKLLKLKNKIFEKIYFFYVKNLRYKLIQTKAFLKEEKRKSSLKFVCNQNQQEQFFENLNEKEILNEMNLTMEILKLNIQNYFDTSNQEEKMKIFNEFINMKK